MKKFVVSCLLIGMVGCSVSPKKLDELNSENNYYSPAQTIKCMQMQTPQRPHPINKKGEVRESYDQGDCYDDLLTKNTRELTIEFGKSFIDLNAHGLFPRVLGGQRPSFRGLPHWNQTP